MAQEPVKNNMSVAALLYNDNAELNINLIQACDIAIFTAVQLWLG